MQRRTVVYGLSFDRWLGQRSLKASLGLAQPPTAELGPSMWHGHHNCLETVNQTVVPFPARVATPQSLANAVAIIRPRPVGSSSPG